MGSTASPSFQDRLLFCHCTAGGVYNIGGGGESTSSVEWLDLLDQPTGWNSFETLAEADFRNYFFRDATVVKDKIVYFGSNNENATYVLEPGEESKGLEVKSKFKGVSYERGDSNSSFCTL